MTTSRVARLSSMLVLVISLIFASPDEAQNCGSPAELVAHYNSYSSETIKQFMYSQYAQMSYSDSKSSQGVELMYKDFGLDFNQDNQAVLQNEIRKSRFVSSLRASTNEIVQTYGDANLVEAYKACLRLTSLRIQEIQPGRESATFEVMYLSNIRNASPAHIDGSFLVDLEKQGVQVLAQDCAGQSLGSGSKCHIALRYPTAPDREVRAIITSQVDSAQLYIPPRLVFDVRPAGDIPQKYDSGLNEVVVEQIYPNTATALGCTSALPEGEYIVVKGEGESRSPVIQAGSHPHYSDMIVSDLRLLASNGLQEKVCFQFNCRYGGPGSDGQGRSCIGRLNGTVVKVGWFPK